MSAVRRPGAMVISLDFELHWGVRDLIPLDKKERKRLLSARRVIPRMLTLFDDFAIHATWATVGLLFADSRDEAESFRPHRLPPFRDGRLTPFQEQLGRNEADDPFHFAPALIEEISNHRGQEIASHSFSHYSCMEPGQTIEDFAADLASAISIAGNSGYNMLSYVFPRNQVNPEYLDVLRQAGIYTYRGTAPAGVHKAASFVEQRRLRKRLGRLLDTYVDIYGAQTAPWPGEAWPVSIAASRYLRPCTPRLRELEAYRLRRIESAMRDAAEKGEIFHLWWHPEDFAYHSEDNLSFLRCLLNKFCFFRQEFGMLSLSMAEVINGVQDHGQPPLSTLIGVS